MDDAWGASPEAWTHFADVLGWREWLLPVVSNPERKISENSKLKQLGKTPSQVNFRGDASGIKSWQSIRATAKDLERWRAQPDHGICVQTGHRVIALDVDVPDSDKSRPLVEAMLSVLPWYSFPERYREGTGKTLLCFEVEDGEPIYKRVVPVDGGVVEVLATGQQFIAEGTYINSNSGLADGRYLWRRLEAVPRLTRAEWQDIWEELTLFAIGDIRVAREPRAPIDGEVIVVGEDPVANWIVENWHVYDSDKDGRLFIECPFAYEHTTDSGPTATAYFPAGTGGYQRGHFDCKHSHCLEREDGDFREALGYEADQFPDLGGHELDSPRRQPDLEDGAGELRDDKALREGGVLERGLAVSGQDTGGALAGGDQRNGTNIMGGETGDWPKLVRNIQSGEIYATAGNLTRALACASFAGARLGYDHFTAGVKWGPPGGSQWLPFTDEIYVDLKIELEQHGFQKFGYDDLRRCVSHTAMRKGFDSAQLWLAEQRWDGVPRVETMVARTLPGVGDSDYSRALSRYIWTALAGRVLQPGVKADMVPVLVGEEGVRKSSWVAALAPFPETFTDTLSLKHRDNDNSRKLRGRLVVELAELKGLASREGEEIRAFLAQQEEEWTPKYMEANVKFLRRCLMFGTTNDWTFLEERMGMRRLLPVAVLGECDTVVVEAERVQLWAEGAQMFRDGGVDWSVERHAQSERTAFISHDDWMTPVARWLLGLDPVTNEYIYTKRFGTAEALVGALGIPSSQHDRGKQTRMGRVLSSLGCQQGKYQGGPRWYEVPREKLEALGRWASMSEGSAL